jgi:hypothetical protein
MSNSLVNHETREHALLSASSAHRWLNCTPSARLEDKIQEHASSYAEEGTLAHEFAELYLTYNLHRISQQEFNKRLDELMNNQLFKDEMPDYVSVYVDYCYQQYLQMKETCKLSEIITEQKIDFSRYVPDGFGTLDCCVVGDNILEIIDFKYGKGVPVYADNNQQLKLYAIGALLAFDLIYDIKDIRLTIVQPRLDNISTWEISTKDIISWADTELIAKAKDAFAGTGEMNAGQWCKFCKVKNRCKELADYNLQVAKYQFKQPALLSDDDISDIMRRTPALIDWANSINDYAQQHAIEDGKEWPGYKLVAGRSVRKWTDEEQVAQRIFADNDCINEEDVYNIKLKGITLIEKLLGKNKFGDLLDDLIVKQSGSPKLVNLSDKRPALNTSLEQAKEDFKDNLE